MKFAFIIMGDFNSEKDIAYINGGKAQIVGVSSIKEACAAAEKLYKQGVGCIELCGAFGESGAKEIINSVENKIPAGYITHLPEQDELYKAVFSN